MRQSSPVSTHKSLPLPPTTVCQSELGKSKAGERRAVSKANSCERNGACKLVSVSLLNDVWLRGEHICAHTCTQTSDPSFGSGLGGRWCQNLSCCQEHSSRCPPPIRLESKAKPSHQKKKKRLINC